MSSSCSNFMFAKTSWPIGLIINFFIISVSSGISAFFRELIGRPMRSI